MSGWLRRAKKGVSSFAESAAKKAAEAKAARHGPGSFDPQNVTAPSSDRDKLARTLQGPGSSLPAPFTITDRDKALVARIFEHADQNRVPNYQPAQEPVFGEANDLLTKQMVPQRSVAGQLPPKPGRGDRLPKNERSRPILEQEQEIGQRMARHLGNDPLPPTQFYGTAPVLIGLMDRGGLSFDEAMQFMNEWSGQGAATSPRTDTGQNLRNTSYLMFRNAQGDRLTSARQQAEKESGQYGFPLDHNYRKAKAGAPDEAPGAMLNRPGFRMMGMHTDLADKFYNDTVDPWNNPKPFTFQGNWAGNMADATADTHNIRSILNILDEIDPGGVPRGWFKNDEVFDRYRSQGGWNSGPMRPGDIDDKLGGQKIGGRNAQTEYPIMQGPTNAAAEIMNLSPAQIQERLWFAFGDRTGLQSSRTAIPGLLNSQIEETSKATGMTPDDILKMWARRRIPLAENEPLDIPGQSAVG